MFLLLDFLDTPMPLINPDNSGWHDHFVTQYNTLNHFDVVRLDDIPVGVKYCVYMGLVTMFNKITHSYTWMRDGATTDGQPLITMPDRIWTDSGKGLVHWIFVWESESNMDDMIDFAGLLCAINCTDYPHNLSFGTACELGDNIINQAADYIRHTYQCNVFKCNLLYYFCYQKINNPVLQDHIHNKTTDIINKRPLDYKSVCYNRRGREHRALIVAHILQRPYTNECIYSFGCPHEIGLLRWGPKTKYAEFDYLRTEYETLAAGPPIHPVNSPTLLDYNENQAHEITYPHAINSSLHVVTESMPYQAELEGRKRTFITEKSYKPFYMMQPFINYGNRYTIKALKQMGYKTFDKWIDHSYDNVDNVNDRLVMFLAEVDRLHAIPSDTWAEMLYEMLPDLLHNAELVTLPPLSDSLQLTIPLTKFYNGV